MIRIERPEPLSKIPMDTCPFCGSKNITTDIQFFDSKFMDVFCRYSYCWRHFQRNLRTGNVRIPRIYTLAAINNTDKSQIKGETNGN